MTAEEAKANQDRIVAEGWDLGFWKDDAQVCVECIGKMWTKTRPGLQIRAEELK